MNQQLIEILVALLKSEVCDSIQFSEEKRAFIKAHLEELYKLSKAHDMVHLVASALEKLNLLDKDELSQKFKKHQMIALYRTETLQYELTNIIQTLENEGIPFMPLKGAVIRPLYPEPWMRTSCDIDLLVHESDLKKAVVTLESVLNYRAEDHRNYHDISMYSPSGVHLELHFNIQENMPSMDLLLSRVWEHSTLVENMKYHYKQMNEYFMFYHIAHMAYHLLSGGCGIKPFLDIYILEHNLNYNDQNLDELLEKCELLTFAKYVRRLSNVWFGDEAHTPLTLELQRYVLNGGVYGTLLNKVSAQQLKHGGKFGYVFSRMFVSYDTLKLYYPILQQHRWLLPLMQIRRWGRLIVYDRFRHSVKELKATSNVSKEQTEEMKTFFDKIGL